MGNKNQAHADGQPAENADEGRDSSSATQQDGGDFDVDSVNSIDDYEAAAEIAMRPAADLAEVDKKLSAEDEEKSFVDPDDEEEAADPDEGDDDDETDGDDASGDSDSDDAGDEGDDSGEQDDSSKDDDGDDDDDKDDGDDDEANARDDSGKPKRRYRLQSDDPVEQRAFDLKRRNRDLSMRECIERAEKELGVAQGETETDADGNTRQTDSEQDDGLPKTAAEAEAEIDRLSEEAQKAYGEELDFEKGAQLQARINKLNRLVGKLQLAEVEQGRTSAVERDQAYRDAERKAVDLYDFVTDPKHPGVKLMEDINERLRDAGDPLYDSPEKPLRIAQMAARELGIAPKGKTRKGGEKTPGKPPRGKAPVQPASGNARTNPTTNAGALEDQVEKINSPDDWDKMIYGT
jgi:hypothetical protein